MGRLTRAQTQERNRSRVLAAASEEFTERGFRDAKIDSIAERADLTRGAVYSNFPSKRALYFAVLAEAAARLPEPARPESVRTARDALGALAGAWVARLPLATDQQHGTGRLEVDLMPEIAADAVVRRPFAQLLRLQALVLGLALERLEPPRSRDGRLVRLAEAALTILHGASQLAATAPGFGEPFNVVRACVQLVDLDLGDRWLSPPMVPPARLVDQPWSPPPAVDLLGGRPARLAGDGVVTVLGLHRLAAVEDAVRAAPPGAELTAVLVTSAAGELGPLVRLVLAQLRAWLAQVASPQAWPRLQIVCDEAGGVAAAAGVPAVSDATETAIRVAGGRIIVRADGFGAGHAAATGGTWSPPASPVLPARPDHSR